MQPVALVLSEFRQEGEHDWVSQELVGRGSTMQHHANQFQSCFSHDSVVAA